MITKITPYKGITVEFNDENHKFLVNGEWTISVTGITSVIDKSRPLIYWAVGLAKEYLLDKLSQGNITESDILEAVKQHTIIKEKAATTGTLVHNWAEEFIKGKNPAIPEDEKIKNGVMAFLKWWNETKIKPLNSEMVVYSKKYDYAGILDLEAKINNKLVIVDFKTSKGIYNEMRYQVAAYQQAREEMTGKKYHDKWIIRFDKETGEFEAYELNNQKADLKAFLGALAIKRRERELTNGK